MEMIQLGVEEQVLRKFGEDKIKEYVNKMISIKKMELFSIRAKPYLIKYVFFIHSRECIIAFIKPFEILPVFLFKYIIY